MAASPFRSWLYRIASWAVISALVLAQIVQAQSSRRETRKGPRALGLLELAPNGKAQLVPVTIMYDGKFYDADAYKASPVPMALEPGTVYEALRTGVSQGLFTITGVARGPKTWVADGTWQAAGAAPPEKKPTASAKLPDQDEDKPPVLRRPSAETAKPPEPGVPQTKPATTPPQVTPPASPAASSPPPEEDKDRPVLRRGKPSAAAPEQPASTSAKTTSHASTAPPAASGAIQIIPAISDAGGAEPRPYTYNLKPQEEQQLRKKMLALAAEEIRARARQLASGSVEPAPAARPSRGQTAATKTMQPIFDDVQLHAFDVSNSNEAVLVLSAKAHMPHLLKQGTPEMQYYVTLVAREDIYGELHKAFSSLTDSGHLDVLPRMELIDAVDAEGDGRGELLFRQISDAGSAFVLYRVIGDQLWPLFQGVPGQ